MSKLKSKFDDGALPQFKTSVLTLVRLNFFYRIASRFVSEINDAEEDERQKV
jgi:hypothetical protein